MGRSTNCTQECWFIFEIEPRDAHSNHLRQRQCQARTTKQRTVQYAILTIRGHLGNALLAQKKPQCLQDYQVQDASRSRRWANILLEPKRRGPILTGFRKAQTSLPPETPLNKLSTEPAPRRSNPGNVASTTLFNTTFGRI